MLDFILRTYSAFLPLLATYIAYMLKNQNSKQKANSNGTMLLLRTQLIRYHDKYMEQGSIPTFAYENYIEMHNAYHQLGGNGMADKMLIDVKGLKINNRRNENE